MPLHESRFYWRDRWGKRVLYPSHTLAVDKCIEAVVSAVATRPLGAPSHQVVYRYSSGGSATIQCDEAEAMRRRRVFVNQLVREACR